MKRFKIIILAILLLCTSCSTIEVYNYYKPVDKQTAWKIEKNKDYTPGYNSVTHTYYSCDSLSSIRMDFTNTIKCVTIGPPLIPFIPGGFIKSRYFQASISIKTNNYQDLSEISKGIVIKFNDTLELKPFYAIIDTKTTPSQIEFHQSICDSYSNTNTIIWLLLRFDINPGDVKNLEVRFDNELNKQLRSNHQTLKMKSKRKWKYCPLFFYMT